MTSHIDYPYSVAFWGDTESITPARGYARLYKCGNFDNLVKDCSLHPLPAMFVKNVLFIVFIFPSFLLLLLGIPFYYSTSVTTSDLVTTTNLVLYANITKEYRNETTTSIERLYESKPTTSISTERPNPNSVRSIGIDTTTSLDESKPTTTIRTERPNPEDPWKVWSELAKPTVLYPNNGLHSPYMENILHALATYHVTKFDVGSVWWKSTESNYVSPWQPTYGI